MENLSNVDDPNEKPNPKPTDDPGAQIETVTPDSQKEGLPNDQCIPRGNTKNESVTDSEAKVDEAHKGRENSKKSEHAEIETVTPDTENSEISQDKNDENGTGIETVTP